MPTYIRIRPASVTDATALATLRYRFRTEVGEPIESEVAFVERTALWMAERLAGTAWRAWVAVDVDDVIVGHVFVQFVEKIPNPVPESETLAYLTNLYVAPSLRNQGIGGCILQAALAMYDEMDVETVFLRPSKGSVPLYLRHGFTDAALLERPSMEHPSQA